MTQRKFSFPIYVILFALAFFSCSDDDGHNLSSDSTRGELVIDGVTCISEAYSFSGMDKPAIDNVREEINTITFMTEAWPTDDSGHFYDIEFECERINFDEIHVGDEVNVISAVVDYTNADDDDAVYGYYGYPPIKGTVSFEGLSSDETLVRLSFNDVELRIKDKDTGDEYTHTISGSASFRRNDIGMKPDYPYANLTINSAQQDVEIEGTWYTDLGFTTADFIQCAFTFSDNGSKRTFYIQFLKSANEDPQYLVGLNLGTYQSARITDENNVGLSLSNSYKGGSVEISEIDTNSSKYPDITFKFDELLVQIGSHIYTIDGESKVVCTYYSYNR